jgi:hypothetical protein
MLDENQNFHFVSLFKDLNSFAYKMYRKFLATLPYCAFQSKVCLQKMPRAADRTLSFYANEPNGESLETEHTASSDSKSLTPSQKRMIVYFGLVLVALVWLYYPEGEAPQTEYESSSQAGFFSEGLDFVRYLFGLDPLGSSEMAPLPAAIPIQTPPPKPSDLSAAEIEKFRLAFAPLLSRLKVVPNMVTEPAWVALDKIEAWYSVPASVSENHVFSYLQHERLWVRLAALQFALSTERDFLPLIDETRHQIIRGERISQAKRFLKRAERVNPETFYKMKEILNI